ncbi:hypothetical protein [Deminuibacter soli]|uniref:Uncharacterized protein n=1 Tax=Deminuibacter soli TaxID=2291815 RepID=A0A3E1NJS8_9BACT|nr:hypothetical protein [Deminuibacter soli]RFM28183.1 hypothetical protein DXN05_11725 [Deminuibacter soli]
MTNTKEQKTPEKHGFRTTIAEKIDAALAELKAELDSSKYDKRLKKASKLLSEIHIKAASKPAKTKIPVLKKAKAKKVTAKKAKDAGAKKAGAKKAKQEPVPAH